MPAGLQVTAETSKNSLKHLFQPLRLGHKTLKHRLNFGAHTANMSVDGLPVERHHGYYLERAMGGAAMIVVEPVPVHQTGVLTRGNFRSDDDSIIPHFRKITDSCHEHGAVMIQQLYHVGAHGEWDNSFQANWSPSGLPSLHDHDGSRAMTEHQIQEVIQSFARAAKRAQMAGFDGCELMAAYNALIEQFWSSFTNRRADHYGGSFANRMNFSVELLKAIRESVGNDFIIGVCVSYDIAFPEVLSVEDLQEILAHHDERGLLDYITVGTGSYFDYEKIIPSALCGDKLSIPCVEKIREVVKNARIQAESHIRTPEVADQVIGSGVADMVSIVRGQIADPHMANKAKEGRLGDIRPCLSCNQMCWGRRYKDYWISCLINPSAGREFEWGGDRFVASKNPRTVLVVGGGPAGCEAARVAAERGHRVTLVEASGFLGGQFRLAGLQPRRAQILDYIDWFERQLNRLTVNVQFNTFCDSEMIDEFSPDVVILATGSIPSESGYQRGLPTRDKLPGIELPNVWHAEDVMNRSARLGEKTLLIDNLGTWKSIGTALYMAESGHQVTIATSFAVVGKEITRTGTDISLRERLRKLNTRFYCETSLQEWHGNRATLIDILNKEEFEKDFDSLVLSTVNTPMNELEHELNLLDTKHFEIHAIGDCLSPRQAPAAIYEGRKTSMNL